MAKRRRRQEGGVGVAGQRRRDLGAGEPAGVVELVVVDGQRVADRARRCSRSSATTGRARAGWRGSARRATAIPASSHKLARDRRLDRLARLDEPGQRRIAARRILRLAAEQQAAVMLGQHDHHRVDARIMFGAAARAAPRPAAAVGLASAVRRPSNSRGGGASWRGSARRRRSARRSASSSASSAKCARASTGDVPAGSGEKSRRAAVEAEEQGRVAVDRAPAQPALVVERRRAIVPHQLRARRVARASAAIALGLGAQRVGAVEPGPAKKGSGGKWRSFWRAPPRPRGGRASAGPPRRAGRAAATSPRRRRFGARDDGAGRA